MANAREHWSGGMGFILAAAGSAIDLFAASDTRVDFRRGLQSGVGHLRHICLDLVLDGIDAIEYRLGHFARADPAGLYHVVEFVCGQSVQFHVILAYISTTWGTTK